MGGIITSVVSWILGLLFNLILLVLGLILDAIDWAFDLTTEGEGGLHDAIENGIVQVTAAIPKALKLLDFFLDVEALQVAFSVLMLWTFLALAVRIGLWIYLKFWGANP